MTPGLGMKMAGNRKLAVHALCDPRSVGAISLHQWDLLVRQGRRANVLARICAWLEDAGLLGSVPNGPRQHLEAARAVADRHAEAMRWEVGRVQRALAEVGAPVVLLKGAAYLMAALKPAQGRLFTDVDIMVPRGALDDVERALYRHGWVGTHLDAYDQRYYRTWMHELPPLLHVRRKTVLDVHHTILPLTAALRPDPNKLLRAAQRLEGYEDLYVLCPTDMVLHSAAHLFCGELEHGLRDLADLNDLFSHFGRDGKFWDVLLARAKELDLLLPLYYALRYTRQMLATPVPEWVEERAGNGAGSAIRMRLMDALFGRALMPDHDSCRLPFDGAARWLLYVRAHYMRMPLRLLVPHLVHKAARRWREASAAA